ncbi:sulfate permease [Brachybacterium paraconglomeratum]|uniref:sulfate permease n=1 Tax=Brachybacterium paraconglomeratum TaxID=173362 RepID=UPI003FD20F42
MFRLIWIASTHVRSFMRHWMPTNILLEKLRTRRGLKFGPLALLLAVAYFYLASLLTVIIDGGGPRWLYLLVPLCVWNAFKFLWTGPVIVIQLVHPRTKERLDRRSEARAVTGRPIVTDATI